MTLGSYINTLNVTADPESDAIFAHEYGHIIQSQILGRSYLSIVGVPSLVGAGIARIPESNHKHKDEWYEVWANNLSADYHDDIGKTNVRVMLENKNYPFSVSPDWYFGATMAYYMLLMGMFDY